LPLLAKRTAHVTEGGEVDAVPVREDGINESGDAIVAELSPRS